MKVKVDKDRMYAIRVVVTGIVIVILLGITDGCLTAEQEAAIENVWGYVPIAPTPTPPRTWEHGRLITWYTPQGKKVEVHEDGTFKTLHWQGEAEKSWKGIICAYKNKFPESKIDQVIIDGTETRVDSYITSYDTRATYQDTGEPAKAPNQIQHWIRTKWADSGTPSPYYIEFGYDNMADCINSLGGLYVIGGPEGHLNMPAQRRSSSDCGGERTYLR